jgi:hypothetical protein
MYVASFLLTHQHEPQECAVVAAALRECSNPLCDHRPCGSCPSGGHRLWWTVTAADQRAALSLLPSYVAQRTVAGEIQKMPYAAEDVVHSRGRRNLRLAA